jgi:hypothetical protein
LLKLYRRLSLSTRLIGFFAAIALVAVTSYTYRGNLLLNEGILLGIILLIELLANRLKFVLSFLIVAAQLLITALLAVQAQAGSTIKGQTDTSAGLNFLITQYGLLTLSVYAIVIAYYFMRGRVWINLLIGYVLIDLVYIFTLVAIANVSDSVNPTWGLVASLAILIIFNLLRIVRLRKVQKAVPLTLSGSFLEKVETSWKNRNITFKSMDKNNSYFKYAIFSPKSQRMLAVLPLEKTKNATIGKRNFAINAVDRTDILEAFVDEVRAWAKDRKISPSFILPVVLTGADGPETLAKQLDIIRRTKPDITYATAYFVNARGLNRLLNIAAEVKPIRRARQRKRIKSVFSVAN